MSDQPTPRAPEPGRDQMSGVREGEDWTAFTETPCESSIAHQRHVWRGLFPDPRFCPGVLSDTEAVAVARLAEVTYCPHLFAGRTCTRCGYVMPPAATEPASEPTAPDDLQDEIAEALTDHEDFMVISKIGSPHMQSVSNEHMAASTVMDVLRRNGL